MLLVLELFTTATKSKERMHFRPLVVRLMASNDYGKRLLPVIAEVGVLSIVEKPLNEITEVM